MHKRVLQLGVALLASVCVKAQSEVLPCGHTQATEALYARYPWLNGLDIVTDEVVEDNSGDGSERAVKIIPVVVHILHNYGPENISDAQVHDAIRIINEDFQKRQPDSGSIASAFKPIVGKPNFEFRLARKDPSGNCTNGITRTVSTHTFNAGEDAKSIAPTWPRNRYMNVWVVQKLENGAGGYTYTPGTAQWLPQTDGIILVNRQFGGIGTSTGGALARRTLTHEAGHWFNLQHTWGSSNTPGLASNCSTDDGVSDTPNTQGVGNQSCNTSQNTCSSLDNVQNIMDYSSCPIMFTNGQATRIVNAANSNTAQRSNLWTSGNLTFTGTADGFSDTLCAPVADFNTSTRIVCVGTPVPFTDLSYNAAVTSWSWTFNNITDGVTQLTSADQNPSMQFTVPGIYSVTLSATNGQGSASRTKAGYVRVYPAGAQITANGFVEDFEGAVEAGGWFAVNDSPNGWQINLNASVSGAKSMMVKNYLSGANSEVHDLYTPSFDLTQVANPKLVFKYAYAKRATENDDRLRVYASTNCGTSWAQLSPPITNSNLVTAPVQSGGSFVPLASQWATKEFTLSSTFANSPNVRFRFEFTSDGGNNLYLEDVNIPGAAGFSDEISAESGFEMFPNPTDDFVDFVFAHSPEASDYLELLDAAGRLVIKQNLSQQMRLDVSTMSAGVYFVKIAHGSHLGIKKLIIR